MPYQAIRTCANGPAFNTQSQAQSFLSTLPVQTQGQLISAMYIGRNHLHQEQFSDEDAPYVSPEGLIKYSDHISPDEYARILSDKGQNAINYLQRFILCAEADGVM